MDMAKQRKNYDELPILPNIVAETVCSQEYTGREWSMKVRDFNKVAEIEAMRQTMTPDRVREFADLVDEWCRRAYEVKADWFETIAQSETNRGRDSLYIVVSHWLSSFLINTEMMRRYSRSYRPKPNCK